MARRVYLGIPREHIPWAPAVDPEKCVGCRECVDMCSNGVYVLHEAQSRAQVAEPNNCVVLCDKCAGFCPQGAISFPDREETKKLIGRLLQQRSGAGR